MIFVQDTNDESIQNINHSGHHALPSSASYSGDCSLGAGDSAGPEDPEFVSNNNNVLIANHNSADSFEGTSNDPPKKSFDSLNGKVKHQIHFTLTEILVFAAFLGMIIAMSLPPGRPLPSSIRSGRRITHPEGFSVLCPGKWKETLFQADNTLKNELILNEDSNTNSTKKQPDLFSGMSSLKGTNTGQNSQTTSSGSGGKIKTCSSIILFPDFPMDSRRKEQISVVSCRKIPIQLFQQTIFEIMPNQNIPAILQNVSDQNRKDLDRNLSDNSQKKILATVARWGILSFQGKERPVLYKYFSQGKISFWSVCIFVHQSKTTIDQLAEDLTSVFSESVNANTKEFMEENKENNKQNSKAMKSNWYMITYSESGFINSDKLKTKEIPAKVTRWLNTFQAEDISRD